MRRIRNDESGRRDTARRTGGATALAMVLVLTLALALLAPAGVALAGRGKGKKAATPPRVRPPQHLSLPAMSFLAGELQHDGRGGWTLEGTALAFPPDGLLQGAGEEPGAVLPRDGDWAYLMGHWVGRTFVVRSGMVENPFGRPAARVGLQQTIRAVDPYSEEAREIPQ